jgi:hypothetical protein
MLGALVVLTLTASPVGEAQTMLRDAIELYHQRSFEKALETLARAKAKSKGPQDDLQILVYQGMIEMDLGDVKSGAAAFRSALLLNPDVQLPETTSPMVAEQFEAIRAEVTMQAPPSKPPAAETTQPAPTPEPPSPAPAVAAPKEAVVASTRSRAHPARPFAWMPIVLGIALGVTAGVCIGEAGIQHDMLLNQLLGPNGVTVANAGAAFQTAGFILLPTSVIFLAFGVVLYLLKGPS